MCTIEPAGKANTQTIWPGYVVIWRVVLLLLAVTLGALAVGAQPTRPVRADDSDLVGLRGVTPSPEEGLDAGRPHLLSVEVAYRLTSTETGFVMVFIFEDDLRRAFASSAQVPVSRGVGARFVEVEYQAPWYGVSQITVIPVLFNDQMSVVSWITGPTLRLNTPPDILKFQAAMAALKGGRYGESISSLSEAIALAPRTAHYYHWRGNALVRARRFSEAIADYSQALRLVPGHRPSLFGRANALMRLRQWNEAVSDFDAIIAQDSPDSWTALAYRGRAIARAYFRQPRQAISDYHAYLRLAPAVSDG